MDKKLTNAINDGENCSNTEMLMNAINDGENCSNTEMLINAINDGENCSNTEIMRLIEKGADVNAGIGFHGTTLLMRAVSKKDLDMIHLLADHGADVNLSDKDGDTPLGYAAGHLDIAKYLVTSGADVNKCNFHGYSPLIYAAGQGNLDVVKLLVSKGADLNSAVHTGLNKGTTPLKNATNLGHTVVANFLKENGASG